MTREEAIEYACNALDNIAEMVNSIQIGEKNGHYALHKGTKQDIYKAISKIQEIVNTIEEVDTDKVPETLEE